MRKCDVLWKVTECHVSVLEASEGHFFYTPVFERPGESETFSTFHIFKNCTLSLIHPTHVPGRFYKWVTDEFHLLPTGVREEAKDWTMTLKDDFGVIAWTWRAGNYLSFFLLLSLFSSPVQSDIVFSKDHHFSWKTGKMFIFSVIIL